MPHRTAPAFIASGPCRWTRNPMCLAMARVYLGVALLVDALAPLLLFIPVFPSWTGM